jgi:hypothetical protein
MNNPTISKDEFIGMIYHIQMVTKLFHLDKAGAGAYSSHLHCQELYSYVDNWVDDFVETLQGDELRLLTISIPSTSLPNKNIEEYFVAAITYIEKTRKLFDKSWQQSKIDELVAQINKFIYKIHFLK